MYILSVVDAGPRIPKGILQGNLVDLGNYHQCLDINKAVNDMVIDGKYCQIRIGLSDIEHLGSTFELDKIVKIIDTLKDEKKLYERFRQNIEVMNGRESKRNLR